jgi:hypothetical protein
MNQESVELYVPMAVAAKATESVSKEVFEKEFAKLKESLVKQQADLIKQETMSWGIIIGVGVAFIFTIGIIAIEVILFHTR